MAVVFDSHYHSSLDVVYVYIVPWSEFPIVPSYPQFPQGAGGTGAGEACNTAMRVTKRILYIHLYEPIV